MSAKYEIKTKANEGKFTVCKITNEIKIVITHVISDFLQLIC